MSDKQRHLIIILSILFVAIICSAIVIVARNFFQSDEEEPAITDSTSLFSEAIQGAAGVRVIGVDPNSPAGQADIPLDAILIGINGVAIQTPQDVVDYMQSYEGDGNVVLTLKETDALTTKTIQLESGGNYLGLELLPNDRGTLQLTPTPSPTETAVSPATTPPALTTTPIIAPPIITSVLTDTVAANAGLQVGDIITAIDDQVVLNNVELIEEVASRVPGTAVRLTIRRAENTLVVTIPLGPHPEDPTRGFLGVGLQEQ